MPDNPGVPLRDPRDRATLGPLSVDPVAAPPKVPPAHPPPPPPPGTRQPSKEARRLPKVAPLPRREK